MNFLKNKSVSLLVTFLLFLSFQTAQAGPNIEHWTTSNGLRVYYVAAPQLPMLDIRLTFAAGGSRDGDKPGVAMLTSSSLNDGAGGMSADGLAEKFESVGAVYSGGAARDMAWVSLRTLTLEEEMKNGLDTWLTVLGKPDFPEKEFKNAQKLTLVGLQAEKQSPGSLGDKAFMEALYGDHPYASPENGTEASINANLYDPEMPEVDLWVRTSGEMRTSNFMLWQAAYAELYFTDVYWPDFRRTHLADAVREFQDRDRRFGGLNN